MNANARKIQKIVVGFGVSCAVMAALPCVAADAVSATETVTVEAKSISADTAAPTNKRSTTKPAKKNGSSAPAEENIGFLSGLAIGAVAGGPIGAVAGGITGALLGEHYHKQKVANHELTADLSGSKADKVRLMHTVLQLDGSLEHARELSLTISFRTGDANLTTADIDQLTTLGQLAGGLEGVKIQVSGHADPRGAQEYNAMLSKDRADAVAAVLTNAGLPEDRITVEALGADGASANGNLDDYAFQRRVTVKLIGAGVVAESDKPAATTLARAE